MAKNPAPTATQLGFDTRAVRAWANANGYVAGIRSRFSAAVLEGYAAAGAPPLPVID